MQCGPVMVHGNEKSSCQSLTDTDFSFWTWTKACQKKRDNLQKSIWITAFVLKGSEVAALQCWLQGLFAEMWPQHSEGGDDDDDDGDDDEAVLLKWNMK